MISMLIMPRTVAFFCVTAPVFFAPFLNANPVTPQTRAIDSGLFANLQHFEQFAAAAYCQGNNDIPAGGVKLTCNSGNCPLVEENHVTTMYEFQNSHFTDVTGYIAVDHTRDLTVLAFRGARSVRNWITSLNSIAVPTDICSNCTAHEGLWNAWRESRAGVLAAFTKTAEQYPSRIVVVGHGLGGAIATFAAVELRKQGIEADLYTYGAPRVTGKTLSDFIADQNRGENFRVTHTDDPVPRLPYLFLDLVHISPEYWIQSPNNVIPTINDVKRLDGDINMAGNTGQNALDMDAHLWYFGPIAECLPKGGMEIQRRKLDERVEVKRATSGCQPTKPTPTNASVKKRGCNVANAF